MTDVWVVSSVDYDGEMVLGVFASFGDVLAAYPESKTVKWKSGWDHNHDHRWLERRSTCYRADRMDVQGGS